MVFRWRHAGQSYLLPKPQLEALDVGMRLRHRERLAMASGHHITRFSRCSGAKCLHLQVYQFGLSSQHMLGACEVVSCSAGAMREADDAIQSLRGKRERTYPKRRAILLHVE